MKKVLLVGPRFYHYNYSIVSAFERKGYNVSVLEYDEPVEPGSLLNRILFYFFPKFIGERNRKVLNAKILNRYAKFQPECVLFIKGSILNPETLESIKVVKLLWMMDSFVSYQSALKLCPLFDHIFCFEKSDIDLVKKFSTNVSFLPLAVDPSLYKMIESDPNKEIDILFIGTLYRDRFDFFVPFIRRNKELNIKIIGPVVGLKNKLIGILISLMYPGKLLVKKVSSENACSLMQKSKIVLNIHHEQSKYGVNPRFFEIIASGAIQIVDRKDFMKDYFREFRIRQFNQLDEIESICLDILKVDFDETILDRSVVNNVLENHTFDNRVHVILRVIEAIKANGI